MREKLRQIEPNPILLKRLIVCVPDFLSSQKRNEILDQVKSSSICEVREVTESLALALMFRFTQTELLNKKEAPQNILFVNVRTTHSTIALVRFEQDWKDLYRYYQEKYKDNRSRLRTCLMNIEYEEKSTEVVLSHSCPEL